MTKIQSGSNSVTPEESARINKEHQDTVRHWRKRKRMVSHDVPTTGINYQYRITGVPDTLTKLAICYCNIHFGY